MLALPHVVSDGSFFVYDHHVIKNSVSSEALLPKGDLVALACYSVTRSTTVSHTDHVERIAVCVSHLPLHILPVKF
jgi:hypothetical protein